MIRGGRNLILIALFVIAAGLSWRAITNNRERRELDVVEKWLDAQLAEKRPLAQERERYHEELVALEKNLAELREKMTPDLDALARRFARLGVTVHRGSPTDASLPFSLIGSGSATLSAALPEIERALDAVDAVRIEVQDNGWRADFVAPRQVATSTPASTPSDPPPAWYGFLNAGDKQRIAEKRRELEELTRTLGALDAYFEVKRELEERQTMIDSAATKRIDLVRLAVIMFATEPLVFATGSLEHSQASLRGGMIGRLARPIEDPDLIALFKPDLSARIVRRYADTVEISFQRN